MLKLFKSKDERYNELLRENKELRLKVEMLQITNQEFLDKNKELFYILKQKEEELVKVITEYTAIITKLKGLLKMAQIEIDSYRSSFKDLLKGKK